MPRRFYEARAARAKLAEFIAQMHNHAAHTDAEKESGFRTATDWIAEATHVLIGAGAGMSVEAGNDYYDQKAFAERFPAMVKRGYKFPYQLVGKRDWSSPAFQWGYLAAFVNLTRFNLPPTKVYADLLDLVKSKEHFVLTSNADGMFFRNSFDPEKVYTTQGDFQWIQCLKPCSTQVWPSKPFLDKILPHIDPATQEVTDLSVLPKCPNCGGPMMMNVRGGDWFVEDHFEESRQRMSKFLADAAKPGAKLVVIEIGVGFNTPTVIRHRLEMLTYQRLQRGTPNRFIRLNLHNPEIPEELASCSLELQAGTGEALAAIKDLVSVKAK